MQSFKSVLAAVEFTPDGLDLTSGSRQSVREAAWLCQRTQAALTIYHSTWNDDHGAPGAPPGEMTMERARDVALEAGVDATVAVDEARPWLGLVQRVLRGGADLVCIGRKSLKDSPGFGSVAAKVLRKCPAPVWAVTPGAAIPPKRILVATDLSAVADRATKLALSFAALAESDLRVLHAWQLPLAMQMSEGRASHADLERKRTALTSAALEHVRGTLAQRGDVHAQIRIVCDAPTHASAREVDDQDSDLVVLGTVSRGGIPGFLIGNTAERLLHRIETSVLAVKPDDFICPVQA